MTVRLPPEAVVGPEAFDTLQPYTQSVIEAVFAQVPSTKTKTTPCFVTIPAPSNDDEREQLQRIRRICNELAERGEAATVAFRFDHGGPVQ